jgi:uncharacterized protein YoxC
MSESGLQAHKPGFCGSCGHPLGDERYCPECGTENAHARVSTLPTSGRSATWSISPTPLPQPEWKWPFFAACVVAGLLALMAVTVFVVKSGTVSRANEAIAQRDTTINGLNSRVGSLTSENDDLQNRNGDLSSSNQGLTDSNNTLRAAAQACQDATQKSEDVLTGLNELIDGQITYDQELQLAQTADQAASSCNSYFSTTVGP